MAGLDVPFAGAEDIGRADYARICEKAVGLRLDQIADRYTRLPADQGRFWTCHDQLMQERKAQTGSEADSLRREVKALRKRVAMLENTIPAMGDAVVDAVAQTIVKVNRRIDGLVTGPALRYRGVYRVGERYAVGDAVTHSGSLWWCRAATDLRPDHVTAEKAAHEGLDSGAQWILMTKRGRDGRDK